MEDRDRIVLPQLGEVRSRITPEGQLVRVVPEPPQVESAAQKVTDDVVGVVVGVLLDELRGNPSFSRRDAERINRTTGWSSRGNLFNGGTGYEGIRLSEAELAEALRIARRTLRTQRRAHRLA